MTRFVPTLREHGPNRRAVVKEKNANEAGLLFSGRAINGRCVDGSPPLVMPPVKQLAATRGIIRAKGLKIPFAKLDISNVFYTCTSPPGQASSFCRHVGVSHNAFQGLPFGRSRGPMPFPELWGLYPPPPPCISYALVQGTVGVGTVIIVYVILIAYEM